MSKAEAFAFTSALTRLAVAVETLVGLIRNDLEEEQQKVALRAAEIAHKTAKALEPK